MPKKNVQRLGHNNGTLVTSEEMKVIHKLKNQVPKRPNRTTNWKAIKVRFDAELPGSASRTVKSLSCAHDRMLKAAKKKYFRGAPPPVRCVKKGCGTPVAADRCRSRACACAHLHLRLRPPPSPCLHVGARSSAHL